MDFFLMVMCLVLFAAEAKTSYPQYGGTQNGLPKIRTGVQVLNTIVGNAA